MKVQKIGKAVEKGAREKAQGAVAPTYPMRINKYLALKGHSTRRGADELIASKQVSINGRLAVLGDKVNETDEVTVRSNKRAAAYVYYAYNKPSGIATEPNRKGRKDISESIALPSPDLFPVLGLDPQAHGLVLLTNDRRVVSRIQNPAHDHFKEYTIRLVAPVRSNFVSRMKEGVDVGAGAERKTQGASASASAKFTASVSFVDETLMIFRTTDNGGNVRHACADLFAEIKDLSRTKIINIQLGALKENTLRKIAGEELDIFLKNIGL